MIREYFIDKKVIKKWAQSPLTTELFIKEIGVGTPRLLSTFPFKNKHALRKDLMDYAKNSSRDAGRLTSLLEGMIEKVVVRDPIFDKPSNNWAEDARKECDQNPPSLVVTTKKDAENKCKYFKEWVGADKLLCWEKIPHILTVKKSSAEIVAALTPFLKLASQVIIVDPYGYDQACRNTIQCMIEVFAAKPAKESKVKMQILMREDKGEADRVMRTRKEIKKYLIERDLSNLTISLKTISQTVNGEANHNRYILTELGGAGLVSGFSEDTNKERRKVVTEEIYLLDQASYKRAWNTYNEAAGFKIYVDEIITNK